MCVAYKNLFLVFITLSFLSCKHEEGFVLLSSTIVDESKIVLTNYNDFEILNDTLGIVYGQQEVTLFDLKNSTLLEHLEVNLKRSEIHEKLLKEDTSYYKFLPYPDEIVKQATGNYNSHTFSGIYKNKNSFYIDFNPNFTCIYPTEQDTFIYPPSIILKLDFDFEILEYYYLNNLNAEEEFEEKVYASTMLGFAVKDNNFFLPDINDSTVLNTNLIYQYKKNDSNLLNYDTSFIKYEPLIGDKLPLYPLFNNNNGNILFTDKKKIYLLDEQKGIFNIKEYFSKASIIKYHLLKDDKIILHIRDFSNRTEEILFEEYIVLIDNDTKSIVKKKAVNYNTDKVNIAFYKDVFYILTKDEEKITLDRFSIN